VGAEALANGSGQLLAGAAAAPAAPVDSRAPAFRRSRRHPVL